MTCSYETREVTGAGDWLAHNPEVAGSNPVPTTRENALNRPFMFVNACERAAARLDGCASSRGPRSRMRSRRRRY